MTIVSEPRTTFNIEPPTLAAGITAHKVLLVAQGLVAGAAIVDRLTPRLGSVAEVNALAGERSAFAAAYRAFRLINPTTQVDGIVLKDDDLGVAATSDITFVSANLVTQDTVLDFWIGSEREHKFSVLLVATDTEAEMAQKLYDAIVLDDTVPVSASILGAVITLTCTNTGTVGNFLALKSSVDDPSANVVSLANFAGGANNPDTTATLDVVGDQRYQTIIWDDCLDTDVITDFLDPRFNPDNDVLDGIAISSTVGTPAALIALGETLNSPSLVMFGRRNTFKGTPESAQVAGTDTIEWSPAFNASQAAIRSMRLTEGANIIALLTGATGLDARGGAALGSRPYFNSPIRALDVSVAGAGFIDSEVKDLNAVGISVVGNNRALTGVIMAEVFTTYKTDNAGNPDKSYRFLNTVDTVSLIREYFWNNFKQRFAQTRLTLGDLVEGRPMANPSAVFTFSTKLYNDLTGSDFALTQAGEAALQAFKENLVITFDMVEGLVYVEANVVPIVVQYRETFGKIKFAFNPSAA